jgi:Na+-transporting NADH:ubiquinone oxidoreductase subunit B
MEPKFAKGGKLEKWNPVFESFMTLAFTPAHVTKRGSHIRDGVDLKRTMMTVIIALVPCLLFGIYNTGHWEMVAETGNRGLDFWANGGEKIVRGLWVVLPLIVVSYGVGLTIEFIFGIMRGHSLHEGFLVSGMLIPLIMPADVPLWMVGVATAFAVIIGKEIFGGTGMNILNVALTARAFLFFAYPTAMSGDKVWMSGQEADGLTGSTALGDLASFMTDKPTVAGMDVTGDAVEVFTNNYSLWDSIVGNIPGSIGETSVIAILIGAAILLFTGVGSLRIMASFFAGGYLMGILLNAMGGNPYLDLPAEFHLVIGGFAFGAVFMATDPVTAAQTATGKIIYGLLGGILAILIRVLNPAYPEGVMLAILFMNITAPLIDHFVVQTNIKRRMKRLKSA